jgi:hypothetical protein
LFLFPASCHRLSHTVATGKLARNKDNLFFYTGAIMPKKERKERKFTIRVSRADIKNIVRLSQKMRMTKSRAILTLVKNYILFDEIETLKRKARLT